MEDFVVDALCNELVRYGTAADTATHAAATTDTATHVTAAVDAVDGHDHAAHGSTTTQVGNDDRRAALGVAEGTAAHLTSTASNVGTFALDMQMCFF